MCLLTNDPNNQIRNDTESIDSDRGGIYLVGHHFFKVQIEISNSHRKTRLKNWPFMKLNDNTTPLHKNLISFTSS